MTDNAVFDPTVLGLSEDDFVQENTVRSVVAATGGIVRGRIRLQKLIFLLDKLGLNSRFSYTYHHYGPYSADLSNTVDFSKAFGLLKEDFQHRGSDGARYSVFTLGTTPDRNPNEAFFAQENIKSAISLMNEATSTVLELAATAYWLKYQENLDDWKEEIIRRKGPKTEGKRIEKAIDLLNQMNLGLN